MTERPDRGADVVTLMWNNEDGTVTTETTDFTTNPRTVELRLWNDVNPETLAALEQDSVLIPDEISL